MTFLLAQKFIFQKFAKKVHKKIIFLTVFIRIFILGADHGNMRGTMKMCLRILALRKHKKRAKILETQHLNLKR